MNIYSFEFGSDNVKWGISDYKGMRFIGTRSRRFPGNMNFIRIDEALNSENVLFRNGTYHSPAITLPDDYRLINHNENMNVQLLLDEKSINKKNELAIIIIDDDCYRLVDYLLGVNTTNDLVTPVVYPEVRKAVTGLKMQIAIIQFDLTQQNPEQIVPLILFNKLTRTYEYYNIYTSPNGIRCDQDTSPEVKEALVEWEEEDKKHGRPSKRFVVELYQPATKYFVTKESKANELREVLNNFPSGSKHRQILTIPDSEIKYTEKVFDMLSALQKGKKDATTFYGFKPQIKDNMKGKIPDYIFMMDSTGKVMTI